jgi:hypothetical protein
VTGSGRQASGPAQAEAESASTKKAAAQKAPAKKAALRAVDPVVAGTPAKAGSRSAAADIEEIISIAEDELEDVEPEVADELDEVISVEALVSDADLSTTCSSTWRARRSSSRSSARSGRGRCR